MSRLSATAIAFLLVTACAPPAAHRQQAVTPPVAALADTARVRAHYLSGIAAFNAHDIDRFMTQFAPDVRMFTPTGWLHGHSAVRARFVETFAQFPKVRMVVDSLNVRAVSPDVVIVEFNWRVHPMGIGPAFHGVGTGVYARRGTEWVEVLEHETVTRTDPELQRPAPPADQLMTVIPQIETVVVNMMHSYRPDLVRSPASCHNYRTMKQRSQEFHRYA
jgi:uncharacterized protein (TIGR02246 family)